MTSQLNHWTTDPEYTELLNFVIEKTRDAKSPLSIIQLAREFKEKSGSVQVISRLRSRIDRLRLATRKLKHIDTDTKVKILFALSAPVHEDFLTELRNQANLVLDRNNVIIEYRKYGGGLELKRKQTQVKNFPSININDWESDEEYVELFNFLIEKTKDVKSPLNIRQLAKDFKAKSGSPRAFTCFISRIECLRSRVHEMDTLDMATKVKMLFGLSASIDDNFFNEACMKPSKEIVSLRSEPKNLCNMPVDVVGLIIERSDYKEQLILRKVSKSFRSLVDQQKPSCDRIIISFLEQYFKWEFNDTCLIYVPAGSVKNWMSQAKKDGRIILVVSDDFEKIAFNDLTYTLKNPKLYLKTLSFKFHEGTNTLSKNVQEKYLQVRRELSNMNHQISAKEYVIQMVHPSKYRPILPFLMPGVLETISVNKDVIERLGMAHLKTYEQICQLEQWKQAKELKLTHVLENFPLEYATHFKRFQIIEPGLMSSDLIRIRNFLSELDNFETCTIISGLPFDARHYSTVAGRPAAPNKRTEYVSHYPIRNSEDYLKFMFIEKTIEVQRKKH